MHDAQGPVFRRTILTLTCRGLRCVLLGKGFSRKDPVARWLQLRYRFSQLWARAISGSFQNCIAVARVGLFLMLSCVALPTSTGYGADNLPLGAILDLDFPLLSGLDPAAIVDRCSRALATPQKFSVEQLFRIRLHRAIAYGNLSKYREAVADCDEALKLRPRDKQARWARICLFTVGVLESSSQAERELTDLLADHPSFARARASLAMSYLSRGDRQASIEQATRAIDSDKTCAYAIFVRASAYVESFEFEKALQDINRQIEMKPLGDLDDHPEASYVLRAQALLGLERYEEAAENFLMARRLNPSEFEPWYGLWQAYSHMDRAGLADYVSRQLVEKWPKESRGFLARCASLLLSNQHAEATRAAEMAVQLDPKRADTHFMLGLAHHVTAHYELALREFEKAIELNPNCANALYAKAFLLATCDDARYRNGNEAVRIAEKLCKSGKFALAQDVLLLAAAKAEQGNFEAAIKLTKHVQATPDLDEPWERLAGILLKQFQAGQPMHWSGEQLSRFFRTGMTSYPGRR